MRRTLVSRCRSVPVASTLRISDCVRTEGFDAKTVLRWAGQISVFGTVCHTRCGAPASSCLDSSREAATGLLPCVSVRLPGEVEFRAGIVHGVETVSFALLALTRPRYARASSPAKAGSLRIGDLVLRGSGFALAPQDEGEPR